MRKSFSSLVVVALVLAGLWAASATLGLTESSSDTEGATTITWDSSFADLDYNLGDTITMTVNWDVDAGVATYDSFVVKRFTPRSKKDPAAGALLSTPNQSGTEVTVEFNFDELHFDKKRNVEIGNAHFKLYLMVDSDGDGEVDELEGYGVNVHVEDPQ